MDSNSSQPTPESIPIAWVDSGETVDSPFSSTLVTPTDDETIPGIVRPRIHDGIDQKILLAEASLDYFASGRTDVKENGLEPFEVGIKLDTTFLEAPTELETNKLAVEEPVGDSLSQTSDSPRAEDADTSNMTTLESNQTFPSSHPSLADVVAHARRSSSALYNLPNSHISIDDKISDSGSEAEGDDTILQEDLPSLPEVLKQATPDLLFTIAWPEDLRKVLSNLTIHSLYSLACQILLFLPWCIAVGAAIALSPTNLSAIAFAPCVNYISRPSTPIALFAHWADYGLQHVTIFAGFVFIILWNFPDAGTIVLGLLCAQFCSAWYDFLPERTTPLGEDQRQMIYHLAWSSWLTGHTVGIKRMNGKYYYSDSLDHDVENNAVDSDSDSESVKSDF